MVENFCNKNVRVSHKDGKKSLDDILVKKAQQKGNVSAD